MSSTGAGVPSRELHELALRIADLPHHDADGLRENFTLGQAVPNLIDMANGEFLEMEKSPANRQVFLDIIRDYGRPDIPYGSKDTQWIDTFWQNASKVWTGEMTAKDWTAQIKPQMQELYDKNTK